MMSHKICFYGEKWLIIPKLSLLPFLIWNTAKADPAIAADDITRKAIPMSQVRKKNPML